MLKQCFARLCRASGRRFGTKEADLPDLSFANKPNDILSYDIQRKLIGCSAYTAFCNKYMRHLSSQHLLLLMRTLYKEYSTIVSAEPNKSKLEYIRLFKRLYNTYTAYDDSFSTVDATLNILSIMTSEELRTSCIVTEKMLEKVESIICRKLSNYRDVALELCLSAFVQVNYSPKKLIEALRTGEGGMLLCSRKTLFPVATALLRLGAIDDTLFVRIYNRAVDLLPKFLAWDLIHGIQFFHGLRRTGFFEREGRKDTFKTQYEPMVNQLIGGFKSTIVNTRLDRTVL